MLLGLVCHTVWQVTMCCLSWAFGRRVWKKRDSVYSPEEEKNLEPRVEARHLLLLPLPDTRERVRGTEGQVMGIPAHSPFPISNLVACFLYEGQRSISFHFIFLVPISYWLGTHQQAGLGWLATEPQGSSCLPPPCQDYKLTSP